MPIVSEGGSGKTCALPVGIASVTFVRASEDKDLIVKKNQSSLVAYKLCLMVTFAALLSGCATVNVKMPAESPAVDAAPGYKVIFGTRKGKMPEIFYGQITGNVTVQAALQESGALKRFKRGMRVDLARRLENGRVLKLPVNYDVDSGRVMSEQDYAIHPGDEILVRRADQGMLNDVFKNLKSPF